MQILYKEARNMTTEEEEEKRLSEIIRDYIELESPNPTCYFSWKSLEDPHNNYNLSLQVHPHHFLYEFNSFTLFLFTYFFVDGFSGNS